MIICNYGTEKYCNTRHTAYTVYTSRIIQWPIKALVSINLQKVFKDASR